MFLQTEVSHRKSDDFMTNNKRPHNNSIVEYAHMYQNTSTAPLQHIKSFARLNDQILQFR